ncbi:MAG TPA: hypothetical protein VG013_03170, partial [Gemmataceae bacterium]|nr:hypothetical protein [Gemmataceae bacterium]
MSRTILVTFALCISASNLCAEPAPGDGDKEAAAREAALDAAKATADRAAAASAAAAKAAREKQTPILPTSVK